MSFPLYNTFKNKTDIKDEELTLNEKEELITMIDSFQKNEHKSHELIYALIRSHQLEDDSITYTSLPYECKEQKSGIKFNVSKLPAKLQQILYCFSKKHVEELKSEQSVKRF